MAVECPRVIVVSGASAGIGACLVRTLLCDGAHGAQEQLPEPPCQVVGLARRLPLLEALGASLAVAQRGRFHAIACDVTDAAAVAQAFDTIRASIGRVTVLVNCAGCLQSGQLSTLASDVVQRVLLANVMGVVNCTRHAVAAMRADNASCGQIVLINSVFGHRVAAIPGHLPALNIYPATKYALTAMTEVYRQEFKELATQIKVTSISPGLVDTQLISEQQKRACGGKILQPEDVVRAILFVLNAPAHVQVHELVLKPLGELV